MAGNRANGWGENLAMRWSSLGNDPNDISLVTRMVQSWYDESADLSWAAGSGVVAAKAYPDPQRQCQSYDSATGTCMVGHYTQVVWARTNRIGCGVALCGPGTLIGEGGVYLVCKYTPAGNLEVQRGGSLRIVPPYLEGLPCATCGETCSSNGRLCAAGSKPSRCEDEIAETNMQVNGATYQDCPSLFAALGRDLICSEQGEKFRICELSCGHCAVPAGVGPGTCGASAHGAPRQLEQPAAPSVARAAADTAAEAGKATASLLAAERGGASERRPMPPPRWRREEAATGALAALVAVAALAVLGRCGLRAAAVTADAATAGRQGTGSDDHHQLE